MNEFHIRRFSGIETRYSEVDQNRGTLRGARNVITQPVGSITFPPWAGVPSYVQTWSGGKLQAAAVAALQAAGAATNMVHLLVVGYEPAGNLWIFAFQYNGSSVTSRGHWQVASKAEIVEGLPPFNGAGTVTLPEIGKNKTPGFDWFGTWIGNRLFLGNGVDENLVWQSNALYPLGPQTPPTDSDEPSQERFPPCTTFITDPNGTIYAAGNKTTNSLRIWVSEKPTARYPTISGIRSLGWSFRDVTAPPGSQITALGFAAGRILVHFGRYGCVLVDAYESESSAQGWAAAQFPATAGSGAPNPNCVADVAKCPFFLGSDGEIYDVRRIGVAPAYNAKSEGRRQLVSDRAPGNVIPNDTPLDSLLLNQQQNAIAYDSLNGIMWILARGLFYCYDDNNFGITGPIELSSGVSSFTVGIGYPFLVLFIYTSNGELRWLDMRKHSGNAALASYSITAALPSTLQGQSSYSAATDVSQVCVVSADGKQFRYTELYSGYEFSKTLSSPMGAWGSGAFNSTDAKYYPGSRIAVIDLNTEDMGLPAIVKEFVQVRLHWRRNSHVLAGVFAEADGLVVGGWRGTRYPRTEQVCPLGITARTIKIRIIVIAITGVHALLEGLTLDWLSGSAT